MKNKTKTKPKQMMSESIIPSNGELAQKAEKNEIK